ncbi:dihydropyrimidinase [Clostridium algidicarnis]|uniref:Dihydropyrimidinase n=1 Tax=Clostridium algidicarnis TaxID=37659 RepID=A0ABS6C4T8_9CLOT|nr:dihydropyrimidinase [Clostridium algidicarnis]MBU3193706.1 dihydropyrimidinase [Clostridium algidicarnis]MBU3220501.1 dihydropyrimidinase [Clostridium algidicarnis]MCB2286661.1 dihydropyrimidinase [Clostridium algidicarnis]
MNILIKNGVIVSAIDEYKADILIEDEKIVAIGTGLDNRADNIIDATGKYILPGGVDEHVHYGSFGSMTFETSDAAIVGGTTTIVDFAPQQKGLSIKESVKLHNETLAKGVSVADYSFHCVVTDPSDKIFEEIPTLAKEGISTLKFFMAYKGTPLMIDDSTIFKALQVAKDSGVTIMVHAENGDIVDTLQKQLISEGKTDPKYHADSRPPLVEVEATKRAIYLSRMADAPIFIVHVSCKEAMEAIRDANIQGTPVYGETCTHYLTLTEECLAKPNFEGAKYVCSPPLRKQEHLDSLWEAVNKGWLLAVGSDHCAVKGGFEKGKRKGMGDFSTIPNGCPGVQDRLALMWTYGVEKGRISRQRFVDLFATTPAKVVGLFPQKGQIAIGSDADIVIFDPDFKGIISVKDSLYGSDYNPFEGLEQIGRAEKVFLRGKLTAENGKFLGNIGQGKYIKAKPFGLCYENFKNSNTKIQPKVIAE